MIYRTSKEKIDEYYQSTAMNQSAIKAILSQGMQAFINKQEELKKEEEYFAEDAEHFIIGKAVDCIITEGEETFNQRYHFNGLLKKPSDKPAMVIRKIYDKLVVKGEPSLDNPYLRIQPGHSIRLFPRELYEAMNTIVDKDGVVGYYMNLKVPSEKLKKGESDTRSWMEDTRADRMLLADGTCEAYWQDLLQSGGKQVLSQMQHEVARTVARNILTHKFTAPIFNPELYQGEDMDMIYQLILEWEEDVEVLVGSDVVHATVLCKCMLDATRIIHSAKRISPLDIKTTGRPVTEFNKVVRLRRGDIQASWYTRGLSRCVSTISEMIGKDVSDYRIDHFAFVVESTTSPGIPLIFPVRGSILDVGALGNDEIEGFLAALKKYATYKAHGFSVEKLLESKGGIVWVNGEFKTDLPI
jgi:hypothetical protein